MPWTRKHEKVRNALNAECPNLTLISIFLKMQNYYFCCIITGFKSVEVMKLKHNIKVKIMEVHTVYLFIS